MLRHFYKMAPFCIAIVDISIPSPCVSPPLPPNQCCILDPQFFLLLQTTLIRGWGIYGV